eukprot:529856-Amphidinium_carterae.1
MSLLSSAPSHAAWEAGCCGMKSTDVPSETLMAPQQPGSCHNLDPIGLGNVDKTEFEPSFGSF